MDKWQQEKNILMAALNQAEQQLKSHPIKWQKEKSSLIQFTKCLKKTLQKKEQEAKETTERSLSSHDQRDSAESSERP